MDLNELVDRVAANTEGTDGDPLVREEVEQVVNATIDVLRELDEDPSGLLPKHVRRDKIEAALNG